MEDIAKTAIGVFIGVLAAYYTWERVELVRMDMAMRTASDNMRRTFDAQKALQTRQQQAMDEKRREEEEAAEQLAKETREQFELAEQQLKEKEAAFNRFFQPSPSCKADPVQKDCANAYMKAKTIFESQYRPQQ